MPRVNVCPGMWGDASEADVELLLNHTLLVFEGTTYARMRHDYAVGNWDQPPTIIFNEAIARVNPMPDNRQVICLQVTGRYWAQMIYQFAHELGHSLSNFEGGKLNGRFQWFDEVLCELVSWEVLRKAANIWQTAPPYANWGSYSSSIEAYFPCVTNQQA